MSNIFLLITIVLSGSFQIAYSLDSDQEINAVLQGNFALLQNYEADTVEITSQDTITVNATDLFFFTPKCWGASNYKNNIFTFNDCYISGVMSINYSQKANTLFQLQNVFFDLKYSTIQFSHSTSDTITLILPRNGEFSMNKKRPVLQFGAFSFVSNRFPQIKGHIESKYIKLISSFYQPNDHSKKDEFNSVFNWLQMDGIFYYNTQPEQWGNNQDLSKTVTYYNFLSMSTNFLVNMRNSVRVGSLTISFEYSVNYNLNYCRGNVKFFNFYYISDADRHTFTYDNYEFKNYKNVTEPIEVETFLKDQFKMMIQKNIDKYFSSNYMQDPQQI